MEFKDFEIRPCKDVNGVIKPYKYELVKTKEINFVYN